MSREKFTEYAAERTIPFSAALIWEILDDPKHFGENDPYHTDLEWLSEKRRGPGTRFRLKHFYRPIFWFNSDHVTCTITERYSPLHLLELVEANETTGWKTHWQEFILEPKGPSSTLVKFNVKYRVIPLALFPLRFWARWLSQKRMRDKLREVEEACAKRYQKRVGNVSVSGVDRLT